MNDIIDRIDELVDEQLTAGETVSDYLTGDHNYPACPHCGRHWHGLRLTERIAAMYNHGQMDAEYTVAEDDSRIICEGSEFIGPQRPSPGWPPDPLTDQSRWTLAATTARRDITFRVIVGGRAPRWVHDLIAAWQIPSGPGSISFYDNNFQLLGRVETRTTACPDLGDTPDIDVKFGPENWIHEIRRMPPALQFPRAFPTYRIFPTYRLMTPLQAAVNQHWAEFTAPDYPIPESPGYDFRHLADEQPPTAGPPRLHTRR